jgi:hypothetical protein
MSEAIVRILTQPELSRRLAEKSNRAFLERYCTDVMRDRIEGLYSIDSSGTTAMHTERSAKRSSQADTV